MIFCGKACLQKWPKVIVKVKKLAAAYDVGTDHVKIFQIVKSKKTIAIGLRTDPTNNTLLIVRQR